MAVNKGISRADSVLCGRFGLSCATPAQRNNTVPTAHRPPTRFNPETIDTGDRQTSGAAYRATISSNIIALKHPTALYEYEYEYLLLPVSLNSLH